MDQRSRVMIVPGGKGIGARRELGSQELEVAITSRSVNYGVGAASQNAFNKYFANPS